MILRREQSGTGIRTEQNRTEQDGAEKGKAGESAQLRGKDNAEQDRGYVWTAAQIGQGT